MTHRIACVFVEKRLDFPTVTRIKGGINTHDYCAIISKGDNIDLLESFQK